MYHIMSFYSSVYSFCRVLVFNRNCAADIHLLFHRIGKFAIYKLCKVVHTPQRYNTKNLKQIFPEKEFFSFFFLLTALGPTVLQL